MKLSKRLETIASFVKKGESIADVGSDHALVPIYLAKKGIISKALAIDNKKGPFKVMNEAIKEAHLQNEISSSLSNGIEKVDESIDTVLICGMGGLLIKDILESHEEKLRFIVALIIDAHSEYETLIPYLGKHGFEAVQSEFFYDKGLPYCVYRFEKREAPIEYSDMEAKFGPLELKKKEEEWKKYWLWKKGLNDSILAKENIPSSKREDLIKENEKIESAIN